MSAADKLRRFEACATPGPWYGLRLDETGPRIAAGGNRLADIDFVPDALLVLALRNAAPAIADLIEAAGSADDCPWGRGKNRCGDCDGCKLHAALAAVEEALNA